MNHAMKKLWRHVRSYLPWRREDGSTEVLVGSAGNGEPTPWTAFERLVDPLFDPWRELLPSPIASRWLAPVDLDEDENGYDIRIDVPGYGPEDLDVTVTTDTLTVRAKRHERHGTTRSESHLFLTVPLPDEIDRDDAEAETRNGILHVRLQKSARARSHVHRIAVNG